MHKLRLLSCGARLTLTLILAAPAPAGAVDNLGRLFFTPQQRQELDRRRQANTGETAVIQENLVTVNGHVSRSSGKTTTWINGVPQEDSLPTRDATRDPARVTIGGSEGEAKVDLKVGQTLDRTRGDVKDGLGGGKIVVQPGARR
ncbi:MAG: hypothetical protein WBM28_17855 [Burkholderiales bacterium]